MLKQIVENIDGCFKEILFKSTFLKDYMNTISIDNWGWINGWNAYLVDKDIWIKEQVLSKIDFKFPIKNAAILKTNPNRCYEWHVYDDRGATINLLLENHSHSKCYFGRMSSESWDQYEIFECPYEKETFYLFNTQVPHTVINLQNHRYLFSIEFETPANKLKYSDIKHWCEDNNLVKK